MAFYRAVIRRLLYGRENHCHSGKIQEAARAEFLDKGFQGTSLWQIVKNAGVTTGAFYGYFSSKEALFNALVEPHATALVGKFMEAQISFAELPEEQQLEHMGGGIRHLSGLDGPAPKGCNMDGYASRPSALHTKKDRPRLQREQPISL